MTAPPRTAARRRRQSAREARPASCSAFGTPAIAQAPSRSPAIDDPLEEGGAVERRSRSGARRREPLAEPFVRPLELTEPQRLVLLERCVVIAHLVPATATATAAAAPAAPPPPPSSSRCRFRVGDGVIGSPPSADDAPPSAAAPAAVAGVVRAAGVGVGSSDEQLGLRRRHSARRTRGRRRAVGRRGGHASPRWKPRAASAPPASSASQRAEERRRPNGRANEAGGGRRVRPELSRRLATVGGRRRRPERPGGRRAAAAAAAAAAARRAATASREPLVEEQIRLRLEHLR